MIINTNEEWTNGLTRAQIEIVVFDYEDYKRIRAVLEEIGNEEKDVHTRRLESEEW